MASADYSVLTPERVSLQYDIAGVGSRGAAALVDTAIQTVTLAVVLVALFAAVAASGDFEGEPGFGDVLASGLAIGVLALAIFSVTNGYFMLFEILWNGQTPGKRLVGVRVMRENGYPIRPVDAVVRNLVRVVDWLPLGYGVGVLAMLLNKRSKRLGDFAGGTIVVREASRGAPSASVIVASAEPRAQALSSVDATLVRDFLMRRDALQPVARSALALRLAGSLAARYGLPMDGEPEVFLEQLVQ